MHAHDSPTIAGLLGRRDAAALAVVLLCAGVLALPILGSGHCVSRNDDWLKNWTFHANARLAIMRDGQWPLWTPYLGGGFPVAGDPEDPAFSPILWPTLAAGEVVGTKLFAAVAYALLAAGTYVVARIGSHMAPWPSAFCAALVASSGWVPARLLSGNINELWFCAFPLLAALIVCCRGWGSFAAGVLGLAAIATDGKLVWPSVMLALAAFACCRPRMAGLWRVLCAGALAVLLASVKLFPVAEVFGFAGGAFSPDLATHPRGYGPGAISSYGLGRLLAYLFTDRYYLLGNFASPLHVGAVAAAMAGVAAVAAWRASWRTSLFLLLFVWLAASYRAPVDLFWWLHRVAPFDSMTNPVKYFNFFIVLAVCLLAGRSLALLPRSLGPRGRVRLAVAVSAVALGPAFVSSWTVNRHTWVFQPDPIEPAHEFHQVKGRGLSRMADRPAKAESYRNVLAGIGTIDWYATLRLPECAQPRLFIDPNAVEIKNSAYRGELYVVGPQGQGGQARMLSLSPNRVRARVSVSAASRLVLNQNWAPGWRWDGGRTGPYEGLCSAPIDASTGGTVVLRYEPRSFLFGAAVSVATCAGLVLVSVALVGRSADPGGRAKGCACSGPRRS